MAEDKDAQEERWGFSAFRQRVDSMLPDEFITHVNGMRREFRGVRKEFWLALRSLIDARVAAMEEQEKPSGRRTNKVPVE